MTRAQVKGAVHRVTKLQGAWLSWLERSLHTAEVGGSSPLAPTRLRRVVAVQRPHLGRPNLTAGDRWCPFRAPRWGTDGARGARGGHAKRDYRICRPRARAVFRSPSAERRCRNSWRLQVCSQRNRAGLRLAAYILGRSSRRSRVTLSRPSPTPTTAVDGRRRGR